MKKISKKKLTRNISFFSKATYGGNKFDDIQIYVTRYFEQWKQMYLVPYISS